MCTIGAVLGKELVLFKNRDLDHYRPNPAPEVRTGRFDYVGFGREKGAGVWAGMNRKGLGLVASDAHTIKDYPAPKDAADRIFGAYENVLAEQKSASSAKKFLLSFYKNLGLPDMVLVADRKRAFVIEYSPGRYRIEEVTAGFVVRTNHFLLAPGAKPVAKDPDSYARYARARALLSSGRSVAAVERLCRDHENGPSLNSVCRHSDGDYRTLCSAIMVASESILCRYIVNRYPCVGEYKSLALE